MTALAAVPAERIRNLNDAAIRGDGQFVLYWCTALRRTHWNFAFQRAVELAAELGRPVVFFEPLRAGYEHASERLHGFVIDGMVDNAAALADTPVTYLPYVEPLPGAGRGLLAELARDACAVVTDDYPCFFIPRMQAAAAEQVDVRLEAVDGNGLFPMRRADRVFTTAYSFRRYLQKELPSVFGAFPRESALDGVALPRLASGALADALSRWPAADLDALRAPGGLAGLPIDHAVLPTATRGGSAAAAERLDRLIDEVLALYSDERNHPDEGATSGLSPYLHFGHISAHEVFTRIAEAESWHAEYLDPEAHDGSRAGWWRMGESAEAFLDQLVTWRELGFNRCALTTDYTSYDSLPDWARRTLEEHRSDPRPTLYTLEQLTARETSDPLWNAAQRQLAEEGVIHNYLRMLWGKLVLAWTPDAQTAAAHLVALNDRFALDGRDPNSYSGIFWCLGRYDRAWGPVRPIYGKVRYMTSDSARRKLRLKRYLARWEAESV